MNLKTSNIRLSYIFIVLMTTFKNNVQIIDPSSYYDKIKMMEKKIQEENIKRMKSQESMVTLSKSQKSEVSLGEITLNDQEDGEDDDSLTQASGRNIFSFIISEMTSLFKELNSIAEEQSEKRSKFVTQFNKHLRKKMKDAENNGDV